MSPRKMTAAKYLAARGWLEFRRGEFYCANGARYRLDGVDEPACLSVSEAVAVQRARDAAEERAAWVAFAAAGPPDPTTLGNLCDLDTEERAEGTAQYADHMLAEYRARFAVEIES